MIFNIEIPSDVFLVSTEKNDNTSGFEFKVMIRQKYISSDHAIKIASIKDIDLMEGRYEKIKFVNTRKSIFLKTKYADIDIRGIKEFFKDDVERILEEKRNELLLEDENIAIVIAKEILKEGYDSLLKQNKYSIELMNIAREKFDEVIDKYIKRSIR